MIRHSIFIVLSITSLILLLLLLFFRASRTQKDTGGFENEQHIDNDIEDIRRETLPDGSVIEYGTRNGPLTPERLEKLKKVIEEEKTGKRSSSSLQKMSKGLLLSVYAADLIDTLVILPQNSPASQMIRNLFRNRIMLWTDRDFQGLREINIVPKASIGGAQGAYDFVQKTYPDGSFAYLIGFIWIWKEGPVEVPVIHEYGHHYTNYWAAQRMDGNWPGTSSRWPATTAGDYYLLRPLPDSCSCSDFATCPYGLRIWEIIAEDYRMTAARFNQGHIFADIQCQGETRTVGLPDIVKTTAYMQSLPLSSGAASLTPFPPPVSSSSQQTPTPGVNQCTARGGVCSQWIGCLAALGTFEAGNSCSSPAEGCCFLPAKSTVPATTQCEQTGGICTIASVCQQEGGNAVTGQGCTNVCCTLSKLPDAYKNLDYAKVIGAFQKDEIGPLAVSAWLSNACRVPGMQIMTCNILNGSCDRVECSK